MTLGLFVGCGSDKTLKSPKKSQQNSEKAKFQQTKEAIPSSKKETTQVSGATPEQLKKAETILKSVTADQIKEIDAKKLFKMHCSICHGFKGDMMINGAKDLTKSKISLSEAIAQVYHGKGLMTPYKDVLSEPELVAVSKYVETLRK